MALSAKLKRLVRVTLGDKIQGDEVTAAIDSATTSTPFLVSTSVINDIVTFADKIGTVKDSGIQVAGIATALARVTAAASAALGAVAPTSLECIANIGAIIALNGESHAFLSSNDATKMYFCTSDGAAWFQTALTKTL